MDRLCDEVLQIVLNELDDPTSLSLLSKRYHQFTQDPYVRASYFLSRYGQIQALFWALGRGKLLNERVIDILLSSGAHLSRYLAQCAMHHYFRTQVPFIKTPWVRSIPLPVFTHFIAVSSRMYGNIPIGKGEDDGSIFHGLLKQSRYPTEQRAAKWENLRDVLEKYKFIPFCHKDPMMAQFPLVLAIEPRLLPYARANGFYMDRKYRNFVFRKMFEKPAIAFEGRVDEIVKNVRELSSLDPDMFLSRTVAAEICMEAKTNDAAYTALKRLDKEGVLKFELSFVVEDLIKLFANTRSVASPNISVVLRELHSDFPSEDPVVRLVLLLTIFLTEPQPIPYSLTASIAISSSLTNYVNSCKEKIDNMHLSPVTRKDMFDVLVSKFVPERFGGILEFARVVMKMGKKDIDGLVTDVALRCLEIGCKGKMLKKLVEAFDFLTHAIGAHVLHHYRLDIDDLPPSDDEKACREFEAPLCRDFVTNRRPTDVVKLDRMGGHTMVVDNVHEQGDVVMEEVAEHMEVGGEDEVEITESERAEEDDHEDLGPIGQDTLSTMIRKDEMAPRRRRFFELYASYHDSVGKLTYPADPTPVGRWARSHYGHRSAVTAVFMLNAIVNENTAVLQPSFYSESAPTARVPTTLKHFKMLARLGRSPTMVLYDDIEAGTEFYFSEEDYLSQEELNGLLPPSSKIRRARVKTEDAVKTESNPTPEPPLAGPSSCPAKSNLRGRKRPRRSTTTIVKSYVVPDSDDEEIADVQDELVQKHARTRKVESNLQRWIKHLAILLKEEQKKYKEKKKREQASAPPDTKVRVPKTDFHKSLASNLPRLRATDRMKRQQLYGADFPDEDYSEGEEDEYQCRTTRSKRRKVEE